MRLTCLLPLAGCLLLPPTVRAQDPMQTLIQEVRQLRLAIERSSTIFPRMQLTLARYQNQQDRVERLERELRTVHNQFLTEASSKEHMSSTLIRMEEQARQTPDAATKAQLEDSVQQMRKELESLNQREQLARLQDSDLTAQVKVEQARLAELSSQLEQLDRKLQDPK